MKNAKGFTLIELMIVIVVLGVLAAIAAPKFINVKDKANEAVLDSAYSAVKSGIKYAKLSLGMEGLDKGSVTSSKFNGTLFEDCTADGTSLCSFTDGYPDDSKTLQAVIDLSGFELSTPNSGNNAGKIVISPAKINSETCAVIYDRSSTKKMFELVKTGC